MSKKGKALIGAVVLLAVCLVVWTVSSVPEAPQVTVDNKPKVVSFDGNVISEEKDGVKIWDITSEVLNIDANTQDAYMEKITGHFYKKDGKSATLTADKGFYNNKTKDINLEGSIKVVTDDKAELTGNKMTWLAADSKLVLEGDVNFKRDDMKGSGEKLEATEEFSHFRLEGKAHLEKGAQDDKK